MSQNQITPAQAITVLDAATDPKNAGKMTRADYVNIQAALICLSEFVDANTAKPDTQEPPKKTKGAFGAPKP